MLPVCVYLIVPHYPKSHDLQKKLPNIKCVLWFFFTNLVWNISHSRGQLKCDGTRAETRLCLSAKRTSPFKSAGRQFSWLLEAEVCASAVVMLDTARSEVVWRVLATHSIRQFPLHFPSRTSPCAITFQLESTKNSLRYNHICITVSMSNAHFSCQILAKIEISRYIFEKYSNITFHWNPSRGSRVV